MKAYDGAVDPAAVGRSEHQCGSGEQRATCRGAVVLRPGRVVHGKRSGSYRRCSTRLECEGVATSLSGVLPEERCKDGSADGGDTGVHVGHERCGGRSWRRDGCQHDCEGVTQRCFRESWKEQGLKVRVLALRERVIANIRMSQDAEGPRHETAEGFKDRRQHSKQEKLRYVDVVTVDQNALEIGSALLLERDCEIQGGIESRAAVAVLLRVLFGSECVKGERKAPRCVILVSESENGRGVQSFDGSVRNERHEPRCVLPLLLRGYRGVCVHREGWRLKFLLELNGVFEWPVEVVPHNARPNVKNDNSGLVSTLSGQEQIEDMTITIANSQCTRCLKRARQ